jgi:hypothetical protein
VIKRRFGAISDIQNLTGQKYNDTLTASFVSEREKGWIYGLLIWIRGNFFIPDARKFWIRPSIRYLTKYLEDNPHDAVVSTGLRTPCILLPWE